MVFFNPSEYFGTLEAAHEEFNRLASRSNAKGKVSKEVFMNECLKPKLAQYFTDQVCI